MQGFSKLAPIEHKNVVTKIRYSNDFTGKIWVGYFKFHFSFLIFIKIFLRDLLLLDSRSENHSVVSDSLQLHGLYSPWNSPGQNTGVGSLSLLKGIFPMQGSNPGLPHCRRISLPAEPPGKSKVWLEDGKMIL